MIRCAVNTWDMETPWNDSKAKSLRITTQESCMCVSPSTTKPAHRRNHRPGRATALGAIPRRPQHWCCNESKSHGKAWKGTKKCGVQLWYVFKNIEFQEDHHVPSKRFTDSPSSSPNWIHSRHLDVGEVVGCKALVEIIFARNLQQIRKWNSNIGSCTVSKSWNFFFLVVLHCRVKRCEAAPCLCQTARSQTVEMGSWCSERPPHRRLALVIAEDEKS